MFWFRGRGKARRALPPALARAPGWSWRRYEGALAWSTARTGPEIAARLVASEACWCVIDPLERLAWPCGPDSSRVLCALPEQLGDVGKMLAALSRPRRTPGVDGVAVLDIGTVWRMSSRREWRRVCRGLQRVSRAGRWVIGGPTSEPLPAARELTIGAGYTREGPAATSGIRGMV